MLLVNGNGVLGLMDLSLLQPLSEILNVSVTELLIGEQASEDEINPKNETILLNTIDYASKEVKKAKKHKKIIAPVTILITIILLDTVQAIVFKNIPTISWKEELLDEDSYVDRGILIDTYYCVKSDDIMTVIPTFKNTNFNCPLE